MFSQFIDTRIPQEVDLAATRFKIVHPKYKRSPSLIQFYRNENMEKPIHSNLMTLVNNTDDLWYPGNLPPIVTNAFQDYNLDLDKKEKQRRADAIATIARIRAERKARTI